MSSETTDIIATMSTSFAAYAASRLKATRFTFIDVGCAGGIDPAWRVFGDELRAVAFDASAEECERLTEAETHPDIRYISGFVGLPDDHPFACRVAGQPASVRSFIHRSSAGRMLELRREQLESASHEEKLQNNAWKMTRLADPINSVVVPEVLAQLGWSDVDFLKIDIDGPDFQVLHSFDGQFESLGLLAARLEVNLYGGTGETEHVFHNTDRFMRDRGFELMALDVRNYSLSALPSRFAITSPAQTVSGRPFQAEAFYARDPAGPDWQALATAMPAEKMAKLAAIFSIWEQPDASAELLLTFRTKLQPIIDIDLGLELLAGQAQQGDEAAVSYADYIALFEAGAPRFYPPLWAPSPATLGRRLRAAWRGFRYPSAVSDD